MIRKPAIAMTALTFFLVATILAGCSPSVGGMDIDAPSVSLPTAAELVVGEGEVETKAEEAKQDAQPESSEGASSGSASGSVSSVSPSQGGSVGGSNASTGSAGGGTSSAAPSAPSAPAHQHSWTYHEAQYSTVWHDAVTRPASICNTCGADITGNTSAHLEQHMLNGENGSYRGDTITITPAWSEQVLVSNAYYSCSCGAVR